MPTGVKVGTAYLDIEGDFSQFDKQIKNATDGTGSKFKNIGKAAAAGLAVGAAGFVALGKASADAAIESEKSAARMKAQLKALGISYKDNAAEIDRVIQKTSQLAGLDDEDLQDAFTNIVRTTGDVNKSLNLMGLAADFARGKQIDVAKAGEIIAKVAGGNTGILSRYGITIKEGATATEALGALQQKFAGQAEAYGKTTAGAQDRFRVAVENLQEKIGAALLPALSKMAEGLLTVIEAAQNGTGIFKTVGDVIGDIRGVFSGAGDSSSELGKSMSSLGDAFKSWRDIASGAVKAFEAVWNKFGGIFVDQAQNLARGITDMTQAITRVLKGLTDFVAGVFTGDWSRAWDGIKNIFGGVLDGMIAAARTALESMKNVFRLAFEAIITIVHGLAQPFIDLGKWVVNRIVEGVQAMADAISRAAGWIKNRVKEYVELQASAIVDVGKWITNRIAEGIQTITQALGQVGGWIKNRVVGFVEAAAEGFIAVGSWITNRIADGITTITDALGSVGGWIKNRVVEAVHAAKDAFLDLGGWIINRIVDGLKGGANLFVDFINKILNIIEKIPGVGKIGEIKRFATGGEVSAQGLARGGKVTKPIVMMGEEAPRHPEWVIPTNPAYRERAKMLLGKAASSIGVPMMGFATGGAWSQEQLSVARTALQVAKDMNAGPKATLALMEAGIVESNMMNLNYGDRDSVGFLQQRPSQGWTGLTNVARAAREFLQRAIPLADQYATAGQLAQAVQRSAYPDRYDAMAPMAQQLLGNFGGGGGGGIGGLVDRVFDAVGGAVSGAAGAVSGILGDLIKHGAGFLLDQLPSANGLDWLKGTGEWVLGKVTSFIKDKVGALLASVAGSGGVNTDGLVDQVKQAITYAQFNGWKGSISSGWRSYEQQAALYQAYLNGTGNLAAKPGTSSHEKGEAVDVSDPEGFAAAMAKMGPNRLYRRVANEPWHFSVTGFRKGGITAPFVGSYATGGVVPRDGLAYVHQGETITPGGGGMLHADIYIGNEKIASQVVKVIQQAARGGAHAYYAGAHR